MMNVIARYKTSLWILLLCGLVVVAVSETAQGEGLPAGPDGMFVIDSQHPSLQTEVSYDLLHHADLIDASAPQRFWINDDGSIKEHGRGEGDYKGYVESLHAKDVKVLPIVFNNKPQALLNSPEALRRASEEMKKLCLEHGFDGIIVDIEKVTANEREAMVHLARMMRKWSREHDLLLIFCVSMRAYNNQWDYVALSRYSDGLYVMFYDYTGHWIRGRDSGPTAPMKPWEGQPHTVESNLDELLEMGVPAGKIIMGIPLYGYDFVLDEDGMVAGAKADFNARLLVQAERRGAEVQWDEAKEAPYYDYVDDEGKSHRVWFENERTYQAKLELARSRGIGGIATWASYSTVSPSNKDFWPTVAEWLKAEPPQE